LILHCVDLQHRKKIKIWVAVLLFLHASHLVSTFLEYILFVFTIRL
jgi:hypothetical protein